MATHESADLQAALNGDLGGIPFRTELSLKPVIDFWTRMAGQEQRNVRHLLRPAETSK